MRDFYNEIKSLRHKQPFVPFAIVLKDGRKLPVHDKWKVACIEYRGGVMDEQDHLTQFKVSEIADIELLEQPVS